jgi:hypothetical protein
VPGAEDAPEISIPDGIPMPLDPAGALCWLNESGFLVSLPAGWRNAPEAASRYNLCFMAISDDTNFHDDPVVLYPRVFARTSGQSPLDAADSVSQDTYKTLSSTPGGENVSIRAGKNFTTPLNLPVEVRYFDNGPYPNKFEAVAYVTYDSAVLALILSAKTQNARDTFLPVLRKIACDIYPMRVKDKRKDKQLD